MINDGKQTLGANIHSVLAHSYGVSFALLVVGLFFHFFYPIKISSYNFTFLLGFVFLFFATILIIWAQKTSRNLDKGNLNKQSFCKGPYSYSRMPTHFGLVFLMLGLGLIINSVFVVLFTIISFIVSKFFFIKKEEDLLLEKYGAPYLEYKKSVRL